MDDALLAQNIEDEMARMEHYFEKRLKGKISSSKIPEVCEDLIGEAVIQVISDVRAGKHTRYEFPILVSYALKNAWSAYYNKMTRAIPIVPLEDSEAIASRARLSDQVETSTILRQMLCSLTPSRTHIVLMVSKGYKMREIGAEIGKSEAAVKTEWHRIRKWLQNQFP